MLFDIAKLHRNILHILYEHRHYVMKVSREVIGFDEIDHISLTLKTSHLQLIVNRVK